MYIQLLSEIRDLAFILHLHVLLNFMYVISEGAGETARMRRLARDFGARRCDKYQNDVY